MKYYNKLQELIGCRGNKQQINKSISAIADGRECFISPMEEPLPQNDVSYQFTLGMDGENYLDFEIYMLKTNAKSNGKRVYYITEINGCF